MASHPSVAEIKAMILQLPVRELDLLMAEIEERVERVTVMELAPDRFSGVGRSRGRYLRC